MKTLHLCALFLLSLLLTACAGMQTDKRADIDALMLASGVDAQLNILSRPLNPAASEGALSLIPDELIQAVNDIVSDSLKPEEIRRDMRVALDRNISTGDLRTARRFFESADGRQVVAAESGKLPAQPLTLATKEKQLSALDNATGASQMLTRLSEQSLSSAMDAITGNCLKLKDAPLSGLLGSVVKKSQQRAIRQTVRQTLNQGYSALSSSELDSYVGFAESGPGQQFFKARNEAFSTAAGKAGQDIATLLAKELGKSCGN